MVQKINCLTFLAGVKSRGKVNINKSLGIKNFLNNKKIGIIKNAQKKL